MIDYPVTAKHETEFPNIYVEVHDSVDGFRFRLVVGITNSGWLDYESLAIVHAWGCRYVTGSAYYEGNLLTKEFTVLKCTELVNKPGVVING